LNISKKFEVIHIIEKDKIWQPQKEPREIKPQCQRKLFSRWIIRFIFTLRFARV